MDGVTGCTPRCLNIPDILNVWKRRLEMGGV